MSILASKITGAHDSASHDLKYLDTETNGIQAIYQPSNYVPNFVTEQKRHSRTVPSITEEVKVLIIVTHANMSHLEEATTSCVGEQSMNHISPGIQMLCKVTHCTVDGNLSKVVLSSLHQRLHLWTTVPSRVWVATFKSRDEYHHFFMGVKKVMKICQHISP